MLCVSVAAMIVSKARLQDYRNKESTAVREMSKQADMRGELRSRKSIKKRNDRRQYYFPLPPRRLLFTPLKLGVQWLAQSASGFFLHKRFLRTDFAPSPSMHFIQPTSNKVSLPTSTAESVKAKPHLHDLGLSPIALRENGSAERRASCLTLLPIAKTCHLLVVFASYTPLLQPFRTPKPCLLYWQMLDR
jgi:hypothetical protein